MCSDLGPEDVRIKVAYCGICGSDIHEILGGPIFPPQPGQKHPITGTTLPLTLGHEMSGTILEVGSSVTTLQPGQKCTVNPTLHDRHQGKDPCRSCQRGKPNICKNWACMGLSALGGGLADEAVAHADTILPLPDGISLKVAALAEPLSVASHMIRVSDFEKGDDVLVLGAGPIGLALLLLLKAQGAGKVFVSEIASSRAQKARDFGADIVLNPAPEPKSDTGGDIVVKTVLEQTEDGVDIAFDATGIQATYDTAIAATRPGGTVFNVAIHEKPITIHPNAIGLTEKKYTGGVAYTKEDFETVLESLASGRLPVEAMITSVVPLSDAVKGAFEELINNKEQHVKILIEPGR